MSKCARWNILGSEEDETVIQKVTSEESHLLIGEAFHVRHTCQSKHSYRDIEWTGDVSGTFR